MIGFLLFFNLFVEIRVFAYHAAPFPTTQREQTDTAFTKRSVLPAAAATPPSSTGDTSIGFESGQFSDFQGYYTQGSSNIWTSAYCHSKALIQTSASFWGCITTPPTDSGFDAGTSCIDATVIAHQSSSEDCVSTYGTSIPYCQKALRYRSFGDPSPLTQFYCGDQSNDFHLYLITTPGSPTSTPSTSASTYPSTTEQTAQSSASASGNDSTANNIQLGVGIGIGIPSFIVAVVGVYYAARRISSSRPSRSMIAAWAQASR